MRFWLHRHTALGLPAIIISAAALIGMIDAAYLLLEYLEVLKHPNTPTPCSVNSLVSCTLTVQGSWGHYFPGIPNPMMGMLWYSGLACYGLCRALGSQVSAPARQVVGTVIVLGLAFSYRLYLASIFQLRGVCPFCLTSTVASTLIALAFVVDDQEYRDAIVGKWLRKAVSVFQGFSVIAFVIGLPVFIGNGLRWLPNPAEVIRHWSFPVMIALVLTMATGHAWAWRALRRS